MKKGYNEKKIFKKNRTPYDEGDKSWKIKIFSH